MYFERNTIDKQFIGIILMILSYSIHYVNGITAEFTALDVIFTYSDLTLKVQPPVEDFSSSLIPQRTWLIYGFKISSIFPLEIYRLKV